MSNRLTAARRAAILLLGWKPTTPQVIAAMREHFDDPMMDTSCDFEMGMENNASANFYCREKGAFVFNWGDRVGEVLCREHAIIEILEKKT